jgi:hypothetical protein
MILRISFETPDIQRALLTRHALTDIISRHEGVLILSEGFSEGKTEVLMEATMDLRFDPEIRTFMKSLERMSSIEFTYELL